MHYLLFVDDEQEVLNGLRRNLRSKRDEWDCHFVTGAGEALQLCEKLHFDLMVTDGKMPGINGNELIRKLHHSEHHRDIPVIMLTGFYEDQLRREALESGVIEFLNKPVVAEEFILRIQNVLRLKQVTDELRLKNATLEIKNKELEETRMQIIRRLGRATEYRDYQTGRHAVRVAHFARILAEGMHLPQEETHLLFLAAPMHDLGKIGVPDAVLLKPGALEPFEFGLMTKHCRMGEDMLKPYNTEEMRLFEKHTMMGRDILADAESDTPLLRTAAKIALYHHEKWNGTGYPNGLKGEEIPIEARIVAVADIFDALSCKRHYKPAIEPETCRQIITGMRGRELDPAVVDIFNDRFPDMCVIISNMPD